MNKNITVAVKANPDLDDCLQGAAEAYIAAHPELKGWDLSPEWTDETRETVTLTVPAWSVEGADVTIVTEELAALCIVGPALEGEGDNRSLDTAIPVPLAQQLCARLQARGVDASWAPDHDDRELAWVYA